MRGGIGVLHRHLAGEGLNAGIRGVLEHAEAHRGRVRALGVVGQGLRLHGREGVHASGTHAVHRVDVTGFGAHIVGCGVDQGRGAGHVGGGHGGAAEGHGAVTGRHRRGGDVRTGRRNIGLGVAIAAVETAGAHGVQLIQLAGVHAQGGLQLVAEAHGQRLAGRFCRGNLRAQVLSGGGCQAEAGQGLVTGDAQAGLLVVTGE